MYVMLFINMHSLAIANVEKNAYICVFLPLSSLDDLLSVKTFSIEPNEKYPRVGDYTRRKRERSEETAHVIAVNIVSLSQWAKANNT